jgi:hypothetical protein
MSANILTWILGQLFAGFVATFFGFWMGHPAPGLLAWAVLMLLVDIRKWVSE